MIATLLLLASAWAAPCDPSASRNALVAAPAAEAPDLEEALCVAADDPSGDLLRAALDGQPGHGGLSRALALWMLAHADTPWAPEDRSRLLPADVRLLGDGVRARRGRPSPVPEHAAIFARTAWYKPRPSWSPALLLPIDQTHLASLETPPSAPAPGPAVAPPPPPPLAVDEPGWCGCASPGGAGSPPGALLGLLALAWARRRAYAREKRGRPDAA